MVQDSILQLHSFALCINYLSSLRCLSLIQLIPKCLRTFPLTSTSMIASLDGSKICWYLTWTMQIQHLQFHITVVSSFLLNRVVSQSLIILSFVCLEWCFVVIVLSCIFKDMSCSSWTWDQTLSNHEENVTTSLQLFKELLNVLITAVQTEI